MLKTVLMIAALSVSTHAFAECSLPTPPAVPTGASASVDDMKAAQGAVKKYLADSDDYLKCLDFTHAADAGDRHNKAVDQMQKLASDFNDQLKAFKASHPS